MGRIKFRQAVKRLEPALFNNRAHLDTAVARFNALKDGGYIPHVEIRGAASPEGGSALNKDLALSRANVLKRYLQGLVDAPDSLFTIRTAGPDWEGLADMVEASDMPYRTEVLDILYNCPEWVVRDGKVVDSRKRRLERLNYGRVWNYMLDKFYPELRYSCVISIYPSKAQYERRVVRLVVTPEELPALPSATDDANTTFSSLNIQDIHIPALPKGFTPWYWAVKNNLLFDLAALPNIGAEVGVGHWSASLNWLYGWWNSDRANWYWRLYGGELGVRYWFGGLSRRAALSGHHVGLSGMGFIYDFETGGRGYLGGKPGGAIWNRCNYGVTAEYGYSLPVTEGMNIDFTIGLGYIGGEYSDYLPIDGHYVWQSTRKFQYWGPTKAEVSLVWFLGCNRSRSGKGGAL